MTWIKTIAASLAVLGLIWTGWQANGWRLKAAEASIARAELRAEMTKRIQAEVDGREIQRKLDIANAKINSKVKAYQTKVKQNAPSLDCVVPRDFVDGLQSLREGK